MEGYIHNHTDYISTLLHSVTFKCVLKMPAQVDEKSRQLQFAFCTRLQGDPIVNDVSHNGGGATTARGYYIFHLTNNV